MSLKFIVVLVAGLVTACSDPSQDSYKVTDGDSFKQISESNDQQNLSYELAYLDAPEREQPFGREAKEYLKEVLLDPRLKIVTLPDDNSTKQQVELFINGQSVNLAMVSEGFAWASLQIPDKTIGHKYIDAQKRAVENLQGIWSLGHGLMIAPWQWRQQGQEKNTSMNHQKQLLMRKQKERQAQKEAAIQRQREYAKQRALQQQKQKQQQMQNSMNKSANKSTMKKD